MVKRLAVLICGAALAILPAACSQSDAGITTSVKSKLAADDTVKSYRIDVDTKDRVVTLSGAVDTPAARERAMQLARSTEGVNDVVDRLTVTPGATPTTGTDDKIQGEAREATREGRDKTADERREAREEAAEAKREGREAGRDTANTVTDAGVTTAVKSKLLAADDVPGTAIDVDTRNGVVTLTGKVPNAAAKQRAIALARETNGVKNVVDRLTVGAR